MFIRKMHVASSSNFMDNFFLHTFFFNYDHIRYFETISTVWHFCLQFQQFFGDKFYIFFNFLIIEYPQLEDNLSIYSQKITYKCRISQGINGK